MRQACKTGHGGHGCRARDANTAGQRIAGGNILVIMHTGQARQGGKVKAGHPVAPIQRVHQPAVTAEDPAGAGGIDRNGDLAATQRGLLIKCPRRRGIDADHGNIIGLLRRKNIRFCSKIVVNITVTLKVIRGDVEECRRPEAQVCNQAQLIGRGLQHHPFARLQRCQIQGRGADVAPHLYRQACGLNQMPG